MELLLAIAILNKAGGAYGILSILTGHHMNFLQWLYNLLSFVMLPFYISTLSNLLEKGKNVRKVCLGCLVYVADTALGLFYTAYFVYFWFRREDSNPTLYGGSEKYKRNDLSQSASPSRELFLTVSGILLTNGIRLYFTLVFVSFTKRLLTQSALDQRMNGLLSVDEEVPASGVMGSIAKFFNALEMRAKHICVEFFGYD